MRQYAGHERVVYSDTDVLAAARARIRKLYREFPEVWVASSGGKDSTVVVNLAIEAAREMGRLPVRVLWIDQEGEWQAVEDYQLRTFNRDEVDPLWLQVPLEMNNAADANKSYITLWDPEAQDVWMRDKHPMAVHENELGTDNFYEAFPAAVRQYRRAGKVAILGGMRCEEAPLRAVRMTGGSLTQVGKPPLYPGIYWCKLLNQDPGDFTFYPIYDWTWRDVWTAIHQHGWDYCSIYDDMYRYGVPTNKMRVSHVHHENSISVSVPIMQEIEPQTYERLSRRVAGISTVSHLFKSADGQHDRAPVDLPEAFGSWEEYRDYLLENLIADPVAKEKIRGKIERSERGVMAHFPDRRELVRVQIRCILLADTLGTVLAQWHAKREIGYWRKWYKEGVEPPLPNKFVEMSRAIMKEKRSRV